MDACDGAQGLRRFCEPCIHCTVLYVRLIGRIGSGSGPLCGSVSQSVMFVLVPG